MTYQVLARKYRPQLFGEVIGQNHITTTLKNALGEERLHHAYLFTGTRGTGKTTVARILAKALNCTERKGLEPCCKCPSCTEITNGSSLDVQEIDGASNTSVEDVREIRERVRYMPSANRYKIYIIDEVHMLSTSAFNALLKTLEEPPAHVVFIFATTEPQKIPATILSRCQRHDFKRIPGALITETLKSIAKGEGVKASDEALMLIAREAGGSMRDAESLFDQAIAFAGKDVGADAIKGLLGFLDRQRITDAVSKLLERDASGALAVLEEVFASGADIVRFGMDVLTALRNMLVLAECKDGTLPADISPDEAKEYGSLISKTTLPALYQMFHAWYSTTEGLAYSAFPKMYLEVALLRMCRMGETVPIGDVVAKLDAMMAGLPQRQTTDDRGQMTAPRTAGVPAHAEKIPVQAVQHPTFEAGPAPKDALVEKRWEEFMRWLAAKDPRLSSIIQSGEFLGADDGAVRLTFANQLHADMTQEPDRMPVIEGHLKEFFKRPLTLAAEVKGAVKPLNKPQDKKDMVREALDSSIVKQAAEIFNAQLHEVKLEGEK